MAKWLFGKFVSFYRLLGIYLTLNPSQKNAPPKNPPHPFYDFHAENAFEKDAFWGNEVNYSTLTKLYRTPTDEEYKWMLALVIYEAVYFGLEFTQ